MLKTELTFLFHGKSLRLRYKIRKCIELERAIFAVVHRSGSSK